MLCSSEREIFLDFKLIFTYIGKLTYLIQLSFEYMVLS